jgi:hypothetical protein
MKPGLDSLPLLRVALANLDWNNTSCELRAGREPSLRIAESLKANGMRTPPLLAQGDRGLRIVCGFERLRIWQELGRETVTARTAPPETTPLDLLSWAIAENLEGRGLNLIEQAIALEKWIALGGSEDDLLRLLGYRPGPAIAERLVSFRRLSMAAQTALAQGSVPEGAVATLGNFSHEEQDALVSVMRALRFTAGMCRDFARECLEVCRREGIGALALLRELDLNCVSAGSPQEVALLRKAALERLHHRRFPILSRLEQDFATRHAALGLGDEIQLHPPKDFEGEQYHLSIRVTNCAELEGAVRALMERLDARRDEVEGLFHITWEP